MDPAHLPEGAEGMMDALGELTAAIGDLRDAAERGAIASSLPGLQAALEGAQRHLS